MPKLVDICRHVRSKNAGPFWITVDVAFPDRASYDRFAGSDTLQPTALAKLYGVNVDEVKRFEIADLLTLKISYPRQRPQGGAHERDMHGGQQYIRLLDVDL